MPAQQMPEPQARTLISSAQLNRARGRLVYRIVLTLVVVGFTLVFIGPLYFLFSDGLKSTTEAVQVPPTIVPAHLHPGTYAAAWSRVGLGRLLVNTLVLRHRRAGLSADLRRRRRLLAVPAAAGARQPHLRADAGHADDPVHGAARAAVRDGVRPADPAPEPDRARRRRSGCPRWPTPSTSSCSSGSSTRSPPSCWTPRPIDGASPLRTLRSVVLPISRPILGVVSIFGLVAVWKDFLWPLLVEYGYNPSRETLNVGIFDGRRAPPRRT